MTLISILFLTSFAGLTLQNPNQQKECSNGYSKINCDVNPVTLENLETVEDFDACAPSILPSEVKNYFLATSGRGVTFKENRDAFKRLYIFPRALRDVSEADTLTTVLGQRIDFPIGIAPIAAQSLAHPKGDLAIAKAVATLGTVMILSCSSTTSLEDVSSAAFSSTTHRPIIWMQTYIFSDREETVQLVRRAEAAGFSAIVVTIDSPGAAHLSCGINDKIFESANLSFPNLLNGTKHGEKLNPSVTFKDLKWLSGITHLPIVAKGIMNGDDAVKAAESGAAAVIVSNHGGRQLDTAPASIEVLPEVVNYLKKSFPHVEVYMDGGILNGYDVYKALARGARAIFIGRPAVWGLAVAGEDGVRKVLNILKAELNETMILAGATSPQSVEKESVRVTRTCAQK